MIHHLAAPIRGVALGDRHGSVAEARSKCEPDEPSSLFCQNSSAQRRVLPRARAPSSVFNKLFFSTSRTKKISKVFATVGSSSTFLKDLELIGVSFYSPTEDDDKVLFETN